MITTFGTALGAMALAVEHGALRAVCFGHSSPQEAARALRQILDRDSATPDDAQGAAADDLLAERLRERLTSFAEGEPVDFDDIPLALPRATPFQRAVLAACRSIGWGETRTYGELAESVGHPGAARAVGSVMSHNRFPLVVPCHRVLAAGGQLGGYSAPQGLAMKSRLLAAEQAVLPALIR